MIITPAFMMQTPVVIPYPEAFPVCFQRILHILITMVTPVSSLSCNGAVFPQRIEACAIGFINPVIHHIEDMACINSGNGESFRHIDADQQSTYARTNQA